ncbi:hypothetical protein TNCV_3097301 [Trichonephila clavipes]|uniref:Uncharacterized protein n=1 Tax=Trichonephila clavipes TaxID=2585209 RepID=A0A8X6SFA9_TRICX|nr:hypothetical protein TNCV_3097301 [Trichonephila clavipes]
MLYSNASGVDHTDSGPHNSGNKSSGWMNRRSPYSKPPDAFMCKERPKKHLLLNASRRLLSMEQSPAPEVDSYGRLPKLTSNNRGYVQGKLAIGDTLNKSGKPYGQIRMSFLMEKGKSSF